MVHTLLPTPRSTVFPFNTAHSRLFASDEVPAALQSSTTEFKLLSCFSQETRPPTAIYVSPKSSTQPRPPVMYVVTVEVAELVADADAVAVPDDVTVVLPLDDAVALAVDVTDIDAVLDADTVSVELTLEDAELETVEVAVVEGEVCSHCTKPPLLRSAIALFKSAALSAHSAFASRR